MRRQPSFTRHEIERSRDAMSRPKRRLRTHGRIRRALSRPSKLAPAWVGRP